MSIPWAFQYERQFHWLRDTRSYLYRLISLNKRKAVLEPGCSIALIAEEIATRSATMVVGLDTDLQALTEAKRRSNATSLVCGDVYLPPFKDGTFDAVLFQFFLLWLKEPVRALRTMSGLLQEGGTITAIAEPDYGGRIDFPEEVDYAPFIIKQLSQEGADPFIGRKLDYLFRSARFQQIQWGLASVPFGIVQAGQHFEQEWRFLDLLSPTGLDERLAELKAREEQLLNDGRRSYFMPVFYCTAKKGKRY